MKPITIHDNNFEVYINRETIARGVTALARQLKKDLNGEIPIFISILNGAFVFAADFMRAYEGECEISFIKLASYEKTESTGKVKQMLGINEDLTNRTVVVLEDIIDTGTTLQSIYKILGEEKLKDLKIATLFFKPEVFKKELHIDYVAFDIPDNFIVGYGLDYDGLGRNLPDIYKLIK
tara:strand:+ start:4490 stop:5026 length:537 start_codon:yes stop_codon:yes gene_type:complete